MHASLALSLATLACVLSALAAPLRPMPMAARNARRYAALGASESTLTKRGCNPMPSSVDPTIRDFIYTYVRKQTSDPKILLITMVTAYRESMVNNLDCGDQDSVGIYQQRPSQGWGSKEQCMDPAHSTQAFLNALQGCYQGHESEDAGAIAQCVQGAQAGNRYTENEATARQLIAEAAASVGDSGSSGNDSTSTTESSSSSSHHHHTSTTTESSSSAAINVGSNPSSTATTTSAEPTTTDNGDCTDDGSSDGGSVGGDNTCTQTYTPVPGDYCTMVAKKFGITLDQFYSLNPSIDSECSNLDAGKEYCVGDSSTQ